MPITFCVATAEAAFTPPQHCNVAMPWSVRAHQNGARLFAAQGNGGLGAAQGQRIAQGRIPHNGNRHTGAQTHVANAPGQFAAGFNAHNTGLLPHRKRRQRKNRFHDLQWGCRCLRYGRSDPGADRSVECCLWHRIAFLEECVIILTTR